MKTLKVSHKVAQLIVSGQKHTTWRVNDEKNLSVNDEVNIVDKVDPENPASWLTIGVAYINTIVEKRLEEIAPGDLGPGEDFSSKEEMLKTFRLYYGSDVTFHTPVKVLSFDFTGQSPKPLEIPNGGTTADFNEIKLYTDGGSRGNPGPSASGYVLMNMDDAVIFEGGVYLGVTTNNQAEYKALKFGLAEAKERGAQVVYVYMDSQLVVNQMKGTYKVKKAELIPIYNDIKELASTFAKITYTHVPRELNKLADAMVNEVLDSEPIDSR